MKFTELVTQISGIDGAARLAAGRTLQQVLTLRNWLIGAYIIEFEQAGEDRAAYGQVLMQTLTRALAEAGCQGLSASNLRNFRQIALAYPGLDAVDLGRRLGLHTPGVPALGNRQASGGSEAPPKIHQTSGELAGSPFPSLTRRVTQQSLPWRDAAWMSRLFTMLTFSHLLELSRIDDAARRAFYELHCLKERWSVREFQRQRDSMLYERVGLSENRDAVLALARERGALSIRRRGSSEIRTSSSSSASSGARSGTRAISSTPWSIIFSTFCSSSEATFASFARQFRITAGNRHRYIDLLLFHRRLRCLVAIDLKLGAFEPEHLGQLRFYVNYLAEHATYPEESPPVGILLCAERNAEVVRFATAGESDLFVTRYQFELPTEDQLKHWLHEERARLETTRDDTDSEPRHDG